VLVTSAAAIAEAVARWADLVAMLVKLGGMAAAVAIALIWAGPVAAAAVGKTRRRG
jgi:divalent metal cation (Fe/Co/Zn/Cd) transporter